MFRNRTTSQKPSDTFLKDFKANFPELRQGSQSTSPEDVGATTLTSELDVSHRPENVNTNPTAEMKDVDAISRPAPEPWHFGGSTGLTPSLMDPNSHAFNMFGQQMPGYYTPTPGGINTIYHSQAGDLHTPTFHMGLGTPLSMPTSGGAMHAGHQIGAFHGFHQMDPNLHQHQFQNLNPFQMHHQHPQPQQQVFAPHQFSHHPGYEHMDGPPIDESPVGDLGMDMDHSHHLHHHHSPEMMMQPQNFQPLMPPPTYHPTGDKFRFHATLNAPTAMIKHSDEIPITYLNKGQAYTLNVVDTHAQQPMSSVRYRTFVRVSFEDEQQRLKPAACWQLWKEGRGTNEAHQRGGRLQAVEYVENVSAMGTEDPSKPRIELESASFDGFCVTWTPPNGSAECPISVRFNFLSTDFSHSKGVKGIPVRLCAKTEIISEMSPSATAPTSSEVCYCKVKLFRDHGAERKLSNDVAHVKKTIDKLNQQIAQFESGMRDNGKRKRSNSIVKNNMERPGKVPKHRRTWSMTSNASNSGRGGAEEDLHTKLMNLQDMFTSTRPASILYLRGAEEDDPDLHPVRITGEVAELARHDSGDTRENTTWEQHSEQNVDVASLVSPSPSSISLAGSRRESTEQQTTPAMGLSRVNSADWRNNPQTAVGDLTAVQPKQPTSPSESRPIKVQTRSPTSGMLSGWVEATGVDPAYQPPAERAIKPVACFYVQPRLFHKASDENYHRAIYLMNRTLKDFTTALALKCDIEPTKILRTVRITRNGLRVLFDDECVQELPEGQDMTAEFCETSHSPETGSREWDAADLCDGDLSTVHNINTTGYELKLLY